MPSIEIKPENFIEELDLAGLDEVRNRLASGIYGNANEKGPLAREWVYRKEQESARTSEARTAASQAEHLRAASLAADATVRAADAAERQATTAERATKIAMAALVMAIISSIISLVALYRS